MRVKPPSLDALSEIAESYGFDLSEEDLESFQGLISPIMASYERLDQLPEPALPVKYARTPGHRPSPEDNPLNAWYWRSEIKGADSGPLAGKTVAIKDNVSVAGVPMMNGTAVLEGYVPNSDATVVTRILDAGGTILGKAVCESMCISGGSHTSDTGPVRNPYDQTRSAGGSSSGSAALVGSGAVDMAIGGDQGGSIRIPGCWCGIYGLKPTHGLVPYTGIFPIEITLDHTGPMARSAAECALLLEAIAGPDGLDPRQNANLQAQAYTQLLTGRRLRPPYRRPGGGLWNRRPFGRRCRRNESSGCVRFRNPWRKRDQCFRPLAQGRRPRLERHRNRGAHPANDRRQRHGHQLEGPLFHRSTGRVRPRPQDPRQRLLRDRQDDRPPRPIPPRRLSRQVLRQGPKPRPQPQGRLRPGFPRRRPPPHADPPPKGHQDPQPRRLPRRIRRPSPRNDPQHCTLRCHGPSRHYRPLRNVRRSARGHDAGRSHRRGRYSPPAPPTPSNTTSTPQNTRPDFFLFCPKPSPRSSE